MFLGLHLLHHFFNLSHSVLICFPFLLSSSLSFILLLSPPNRHIPFIPSHHPIFSSSPASSFLLVSFSPFLRFSLILLLSLSSSSSRLSPFHRLFPALFLTSYPLPLSSSSYSSTQGKQHSIPHAMTTMHCTGHAARGGWKVRMCAQGCV